MRFEAYETDGFYDELFLADGRPRPEFHRLVDRINSLRPGDFERRQRAAERNLMHMGITFNVYGDNRGQERILPFDLVPRLVRAEEWQWIEKGLKQRIRALNLFIDDLYHEQKIVRDRVVPSEVVQSAQGFRKECVGLDVPRGVWSHITGTDLVRNADGQIHVLEDNLRVPSGVSYVLQNRSVLKQTFPNVLRGLGVRGVNGYPGRLRAVLEDVAPPDARRVKMAVLTPGCYNSAYFEHSFLAQQMGIELVEGRDLVVENNTVFMRTTAGLQRVHVIYRRIDDDFLDPQAFRPDSLLGIPGVMEAYRRNRVTLVNAPGTGVADDKVIYAYVPKIIKYYLGEDAVIPNVPTYMCWDRRQRDYVLENIEKLVVKPANESGGYGMLVGPHATAAEHDDFRQRIRADGRNYIGQTTLSLSRVPTLIEDRFEGRHVDLRPFILYGREIFVLPGGLTRVALRKGSLVVNSSQGGGSKDTWVLARPAKTSEGQTLQRSPDC